MDDTEHFCHIAQKFIVEQKTQQKVFQKSDQQYMSIQLGISLVAIVLLSQGSKDAVQHILDSILLAPKERPVPKVYFVLSRSLSALLPLPKDLRPIERTEEVQAWIDVNMHKLHWDNTRGNYSLLENNSM